MIWKSVLLTWCATLRAPIPLKVKLYLLGYILKRVLLWPFGAALWQLDKLILLFMKAPTRARPVYIISRPRSGSTFLHRTLAEDEATFFALTYLEWRWPYLCVWMLIDAFKLRDRINAWSYWPDTPFGEIAAQMHPHTWGDYEEHGIFLEEHCFTHYFMFRRFPFKAVLNNARSWKWSGPTLHKIYNHLMAVVDKVDVYRGRGRRWLTKENETTAFYHVLKAWHPGDFIFLTRSLDNANRSFDRLSLMSTKAKLGIDPRAHLPGWFEQNFAFREEEDQDFYLARENFGKIQVQYEYFVVDPRGVIKRVYHQLNIPCSQIYSAYLARLNQQQLERFADETVRRPQ